MSNLLPPNKTQFESIITNTLDHGLNPEIIRKLWDPETCPESLLPYLAWALSVDVWRDDLRLQEKRALVKESISLHRKKGTPWAIKRALLTLGFEATLLEKLEDAHWAEFDCDVSTHDRIIHFDTEQEIISIINAYKAERSHLRKLRIFTTTTNICKISCITNYGETVSVFPIHKNDKTSNG